MFYVDVCLSIARRVRWVKETDKWPVTVVPECRRYRVCVCDLHIVHAVCLLFTSSWWNICSSWTIQNKQKTVIVVFSPGKLVLLFMDPVEEDQSFSQSIFWISLNVNIPLISQMTHRELICLPRATMGRSVMNLHLGNNNNLPPKKAI